jgi:cell division protein FtsN
MEDKKTLWIMLGIGICVLVVVAVGFFWFLPDDKSLATAGSVDSTVQSGKADFDAIEWVRKEKSFPGIEKQEEPSDDFVVVSGDLVYGLPENADSETQADTGEGQVIELELPEQKPVRETAAIEVKPAVPVRRVEPKPVQPEPVERRPVKTTEYWIQAGSFSSVHKASEVKDTLSEKGIAGAITTTELNGSNFYRVRLGPYSEKPEAEKFLGWVKSVDGFESSYISEVYVTK